MVVLRWPGVVAVALLIVLALFWLMHLGIAMPPVEQGPVAQVEGIEMVEVRPEQSEPEELVRDLGPPPPPAPAALARPELPSMQIPGIDALPLDAGPVVLAGKLSGSGLKLGSSGSFGGFAGGGKGGGGGSGYGTGQGFKGSTLIPLSTARPQMPEWACKQGIRGWVEVVFTVLPTGKVANVRLIDADPRGVFEAAAIESVANWIYESYPKAREVKQKVEMDPADCAYNWQ
ncbi:MAG: energy transducer TonB [Sinimarinibacterium sp.]|jgi:protein TonB